MPRLLWRDAQGIEGSLDLSAQEIKIGRALDCAIRTDDAMVSRYHARIMWNGAGFLLEDLGSSNGVYFQEQRVANHMFNHGDAVRCGSLWLRFVDGQGQGANVAPLQDMAAVAQGASYGGPSGSLNIAQPVSSGPPLGMTPPMPMPMPQPGPGPGTNMQPMPMPNGLAGSEPRASNNVESDLEIRNLRRRLEQMQAELRVYRAQKFNQDTARRMEDLENDLSTMEIERDNLKSRLETVEQSLATEAGSVKVRRALEIASATAEAASALNDLLSSLRIEVMAAEGEFDQYGQSMPRASFELIRQSMRNAAGQCDQARDLLRRLREAAE